MDIFPIALNNRDMNILMRIVEEHGSEGFPYVPGFEDSSGLDEDKARISQMSPREMRFFLTEFSRGIAWDLHQVGPIVQSPVEDRFVLDQGQLEAHQSARKAIATLYSLKQRVRRSRG